MNRRQFLTTASLAALAAWQPVRAFARRDDAPFTALRRGVGTFVGQGGTVGWLATPDALVVVDTQFPDSAAQLWTGLHERTPREIDFVINTHHHSDHTAGNVTLRPHAKRIVAHQNASKLIEPHYKVMTENGRQNLTVVPFDETFDTDWKQDVGDETIHLYYEGPAHTSGDAIVHFEKANVVHMGDLVFNRIPSFFDPAGGTTVKGWIEVVEKAHARFDDDTLFIFGHGSEAFGVTGKRADLLVERDFLAGLVDYVEKGIAAGKTADELASVDRLDAFPDHYNADWANVLQNGIRATHAELTK